MTPLDRLDELREENIKARHELTLWRILVYGKLLADLREGKTYTAIQYFENYLDRFGTEGKFNG